MPALPAGSEAGMHLLRGTAAVLRRSTLLSSTSPVDPGASPATLCLRSRNWGGMLMPFCFPDYCFPVSYLGALFL